MAANSEAKRAADLSDEEVAEKHRAWMVEHGKSYKDEEEREMRMKIFRENLLFVDEHNRGRHSYTVGLNKFSDLTDEEFRRGFCGGLRVPEEKGGGKARVG